MMWRVVPKGSRLLGSLRPLQRVVVARVAGTCSAVREHGRRRLSTAAKAAKKQPDTPMSAPAHQHVDTGNFFLDNPALFGSLFVVCTCSYFYYNKRGNDARTELIDSIDADAAVSPREIRQLREDNNITVDKFNKLIESTLEEFADGRPVSYADFNRLLMENVFTDGDMVHWGHHLERVLKHLQAEKDPDAVGLDARLLLTAMSLGLKAKAADRVAPLFAIFSPDGETMSVDDFISCIGALRDTFQLPSEFQIHKTAKYPFPVVERMSPEELALDAISQCEEVTADTTLITASAFRKMLMSKNLCTWGECFAKKKKRKKKKKKKATPAEEIMLATAAEESEAAKALGDDLYFQPSASFDGPRPGYAFKMGPQGVGYYPDARSALEARKSGELPPLPESDPAEELSVEEASQ